MSTQPEAVAFAAPRLQAVPARPDAPEPERAHVGALPQRTRVAVQGSDALSRAGVEHLLRDCREIAVAADGPVDLVLVVGETADEQVLSQVRAVRVAGGRVVLVLQLLDDAGLLAVVEAGASGVLRRTEATPASLERAVRLAAGGDGSLPPDLLGRLLTQVRNVSRQVLGPRGLTWGALSARETDVLRLIADGHDTAEVAQQLCWSERTVKNVVHDVTTRLHLRNRTHAVAYAVRQGLI